MSEKKSSYDPKSAEEKWYPFWEKGGFFSADAKSNKKPFCSVMPPPNVTGVLHMGHALVSTLQDIQIRYHRMLGYEALWIPGTDHAGISTQTVVEKHLLATTGKRRNEFTREDFLAKVWQWKEEKQFRILEQIQKLGCSCDWDRLRFTMDDRSNHAVRTLFKKLFDDGLIYRGDYLVNWDPVTQTALADDEVEHEERDSSLWYFRYPLADGSDTLIIATTRPETMLGDTAVAVSPKDPRFSSMIGKEILLPLMNRKIPIIADYHVDPEFGSGVVKITPAHDPNDYQIGQQHHLDMINIMTEDGHINENGGKFASLSMIEAREAVVKEMQALDLVEKIEPYKLRVGVSYRSKAVIEPFLSKQWFIKMEPFKKLLIDAVKDKKVEIIPEHWEATYFHWIENLRDWCISRQLWWGHRIPIWYNKENPEEMICYDGEEIPPKVKDNEENWYQDEDVLDTWFSSAIWPCTTLGWPEKTEDIKKFYPNAVLMTGHDILFFWVARMIMMGEYLMEKEPFHKTFLHGLIYGKSYWRKEKNGSITYVSPEEKLQYDLGKPTPKEVESKWEKMSKSKGNTIDPIELIDTYGADAMRIALTASATHARQIDLDRRRFEEYKNFANKVWNGYRFIMMQIESKELSPLTAEEFSKGLEKELFTLEDRWILSKMNRATKAINESLQNYYFDKAAKTAYEFFWNDFCSYYLELCKPYLYGKEGTDAIRKNKQKILVIILLTTMRLFHPITPFITEEIFSHIKELLGCAKENEKADTYTKDAIKALHKEACIVAPYPTIDEKTPFDEISEKEFLFITDLIYWIRNIRAEMQVPLGMKTDIFFLTDAKDKKEKVQTNLPMIKGLIPVKEIFLVEDASFLDMNMATALHEGVTIAIPLPAELMEKEKNRLIKEKEKCESQIPSLQNKLSNSSFLEKAPQNVIEKMKTSLKEMEEKVKEIEKKIHKL